MRLATTFALFSLLPVSVNAAAGSTPSRIDILLCTGDGVTRAIALGVPAPGKPSNGDDHHCPKACHSSCSRKRSFR